jgi:hypothetical protein
VNGHGTPAAVAASAVEEHAARSIHTGSSRRHEAFAAAEPAGEPCRGPVTARTDVIARGELVEEVPRMAALEVRCGAVVPPLRAATQAMEDRDEPNEG